jgi:hypothetical protein
MSYPVLDFRLVIMLVIIGGIFVVGAFVPREDREDSSVWLVVGSEVASLKASYIIYFFGIVLFSLAILF